MEKVGTIKIEINEALENLQKVDGKLKETYDGAKKGSDDYSKSIKNEQTVAEEKQAKIRQLLKQEMEDLAELRIRAKNARDPKDIEMYNKRIQETGARIKGLGGNFQEFTKVSQMGIKQMRDELRKLQEMSFEGLSESEIQQVKGRMAELTDASGKARNEINAMSEDALPALVGTLQTLVATSQIVVGTFTMIGEATGMDTEKLQKFQRITVQLISTTQALAQVQQALVAGQIKARIVTLGQTVARGALATATGIATAAQWLWTKSILAFSASIYNIPVFGWILAAVTGITVAIVALVRYWDKVTGAFKSLGQWMGIVSDDIDVVAKKTESYTERIEKQIKAKQKLIENGRHELRLMKARGDSIDDIKAKERELMLMEIENAKLRIKMEISKGGFTQERKKLIEEEIIALKDLRKELEVFDTSETKRKKDESEKQKEIAQKQAEENQKARQKELEEAEKLRQQKIKLAIEENKELSKLKVENIKDTNDREMAMLKLQHEEQRNAIIEKYGKDTELLKELETKQYNEISQLREKLFMQEQDNQQKLRQDTFKDIMEDETISQKERMDLLHEFYENGLIARENYEEGIKEIQMKYENEEKERKQELYDNIKGMGQALGGAIVSVYEAIASGAEEGSMREKQAKKKAAIASLAVTNAEAIASLAAAIIKAQGLLPPLNIIEGLRIGAVGATQLAKIVQSVGEIQKLEKGGRGEFSGKRHSQGGIRFGNVEVEDKEKFWVLSRQHSKKYGHIMDRVFDDIQRGKVSQNGNIFAPNIELNDEHTKKIYNHLSGQQDIERGNGYRIIKSKKLTRKIYE